MMLLNVLIRMMRCSLVTSDQVISCKKDPSNNIISDKLKTPSVDSSEVENCVDETLWEDVKRKETEAEV